MLSITSLSIELVLKANPVPAFLTRPEALEPVSIKPKPFPTLVLMFPATSSFSPGAVVPMPTLPPAVIVILVVCVEVPLAVLNFI